MTRTDRLRYEGIEGGELLELRLSKRLAAGLEISDANKVPAKVEFGTIPTASYQLTSIVCSARRNGARWGGGPKSIEMREMRAVDFGITDFENVGRWGGGPRYHTLS